MNTEKCKQTHITSIRLDAKTVEELRAIATAQHRSLSGMIAFAVNSYLVSVRKKANDASDVPVWLNQG